MPMMLIVPDRRFVITDVYILHRWIEPNTFNSHPLRQSFIVVSASRPPLMAPASLTRLSGSGQVSNSAARAAPVDKSARISAAPMLSAAAFR